MNYPALDPNCLGEKSPGARFASMCLLSMSFSGTFSAVSIIQSDRYADMIIRLSLVLVFRPLLMFLINILLHKPPSRFRFESISPSTLADVKVSSDIECVSVTLCYPSLYTIFLTPDMEIATFAKLSYLGQYGKGWQV